ncbi:hypothetical protein SISSUDRAFT_982060 [Sistotremastrum suecicum HHB10207 ss-3]|uniref:Molybdopterin synthase sulfur carrier subunit n=1 Tax=Sistotremastrum suecicum HHB10207 ss-3 TaxID=1314776 RepID=A0A166G4T4_9AGAM|nr:hypothetical protein SISSUDRAFT_982060 [Sistotremastrum suecicum HHB10207 ss-3]
MPHAISVSLLYFAGAFSAIGRASESLTLTVKDAERGFPLSDLAAVILERHPGNNLDKVLETSQWSVDAEMVDDPNDVYLKGGEEVAVIPPVSGG